MVDFLWAKDGRRLESGEHVLAADLTLDKADLNALRQAAAPWAASLAGVAEGRVRVDMEAEALRSSGDLRIDRLAAALPGAAGSHAAARLVLRHDIRREGAGDGAWSGTFRAEVADARIAPMSEAGKPLALDRFEAEGRVSGDLRVDLDRFVAAADFGAVEGSGSFGTRKEASATRGRLVVRADAAKLAEWLGGLPAVSGAISSNVDVAREPAGVLAIRGGTTIADFAAPEIPGVGAIREREIVFKHDFDYGEDVIRVHDVQLRSSFATAHCTGALQPGADHPGGQGAAGGVFHRHIHRRLFDRGWRPELGGQKHGAERGRAGGE